MDRTYELVLLLHPDLEIDVEAPIKKIESLITDTGGKIIKRDNWGKKRLAYRIKHQDFAVYVCFEIALAPEAVRQVESALLITDEVLRHLLVVQEAAAAKIVTKNSRPAEKKVAVAEEV